MNDDSVRYVGDPDFHDGHILDVSDKSGDLYVVVAGQSGKHYRVRFSQVRDIEAVTPTGMLLYGLIEKQPTSKDGDSKSAALYQYEFVNWHVNNDENDDDEPEQKKLLKFLAASFDFEILS